MTAEIAVGRELAAARERTDELFRMVRPDSIYERPIAERHRIIFYLGHVEAFDWNLIAGHALDRPAFHPAFDRLFAFGIDPPPGKLPEDVPGDWPSIAEVERYNQRARDEIDRLVAGVPERILNVAVEHRLMHAETLAYILHQLPYHRKTGASASETAARPAQPSMAGIPAGRARLGLAPDAGFGWDNEFQAHEVEVPGFAIGRYKVTNREYLAFVREGAEPPFFWADRGGRWLWRGMFAEIPLPLDWPVYVTREQASAYAAWRGMRLPSEAEFHRAAALSPPSRSVDFRGWDPIPVNAEDPDGERPAQMNGNGWEWTSTVFEPFPGFQPFPFYPNYSAPFFDGGHYVLKGGSPRTAARFLRPSFRNWFRPAYPYIYATCRVAQS